MEIALDNPSTRDNSPELFLSQIDSLRKEQDELNKKLVELRSNHFIDKRNYKILEQKYHKTEIQWNELQKQMSTLFTTKANLVQKIDKYDKKIANSKTILDKLNSRINEVDFLREKLSHKTALHQIRVATINEDLNEKHKSLSDKIQQLKETVCDRKRKENFLNQKLDAPPSIEQLESYLKDLSEEYKKLALIS